MLQLYTCNLFTSMNLVNILQTFSQQPNNLKSPSYEQKVVPPPVIKTTTLPPPPPAESDDIYDDTLNYMVLFYFFSSLLKDYKDESSVKSI